LKKSKKKLAIIEKWSYNIRSIIKEKEREQIPLLYFGKRKEW